MLNDVGAIVIGASAGAIEALGEILPKLPAETPWPIIVVVHIPPNQPSLLDTLFGRRCALPCRQPFDKQPITPGIWFAPPDYHLLIEADQRFSLSIEEPVGYSRPSVDVLFESAADVYGAHLACVVLTGANDDGARGARRIRDEGGYVIVQDPSTAEASMMPTVAIERADPQMIATVAAIAQFLRSAALEAAPR